MDGSNDCFDVRLVKFVAMFGVTLMLGCSDRGSAKNADHGAVSMVGDSSAECVGCEKVTLTKIASYGASDDTVLLGNIPTLARFTDGRLLAYVPQSEHPILIYRSNSQPMVLGKSGGGPGEYSIVHGVFIGANDSIVVAHDRSRISVFDGSGKYVRSSSSDASLRGDAVPMPMDRFLVVGSALKSKGVDLPLHLIGSDGKVIRSFGEPPMLNSGMGTNFVSVSNNGSIWASEKAANYRLFRVDSSGKPVALVVGATPRKWYLSSYGTQDDFARAMSKQKPVNVSKKLDNRPANMPVSPRSYISGLRAGDDVLDVSFLVPAERWDTVTLEYAAASGSEPSRAPREDVQLRLYQTVVDKIDLPSNRLRSRKAIPGYGMILNDGTFAQIRTESDGRFVVDVFEVRTGSGK